MARETMREMMAGVAYTGKPRLIANNTVEYETAEGERVIRLHRTDIVRKLGDKVTLNSGGWRTLTTKGRINHALPAGVSFYSHRGRWLIGGAGEAVPFFDGITIIGGKLPKPNLRAAKRETKLAADIAKFVKRLDKLDRLPLPDTGDCWLCMFRGQTIEAERGLHGTIYRPADDGPKVVAPAERDVNPHHLAEHVREGYLHGTLLLNAMRWAGWGEGRIAIVFAANGKGWDRGWRDTKNALRRYLRMQLGLSA